MTERLTLSLLTLTVLAVGVANDLQKQISHLRYMSLDELALTQLCVLYPETFT